MQNNLILSMFNVNFLETGQGILNEHYIFNNFLYNI